MQNSRIKKAGIVFILMCVLIFLIGAPQWVSASSLDTEGSGTPCSFTCSVTAVRAVEASNVGYKYEFDGVCNFGGTGERLLLSRL